jgi:hypothetical protein
MKMKDIPRLFPIWFLPILVFIAWYAMICAAGCRGGRALGNGSAGTVIIPQTPQEINRQNLTPLPPLEPLPPPPLIQPPIAPQVELTPAKTRPTSPKIVSADPTPVKDDVKAAGELEPFKPSTSIIAGDGGYVHPLPPPVLEEKVDNSDNKVIIKNKEDMKVNWTDLLSFYLLCAVALIVAYMLYDIGKIAVEYWKDRKSTIKPKKRASKKVAKKRGLTKNKKSISSKKKVTRKPRT